MGFAGIIGQGRQLEILRLALAKDRLHHAYLFTGPEGVGKRCTALALALAIHCVEKNGDYCGRCVECERIKDRNHPDVRMVEPLEGKKEISIQQIRDVEKELRYRSFSGGRKITIIDPATLLNSASQNALLKTLEEPPDNSLLILIAASAGALLPTLRSRCLQLSFGPLPRNLIAGFLVSEKSMKPKDAEILAALSAGSLGAALEMDGEDLRERRRVWVGILAALRAGDYRGAMDAAEVLGVSRDEALDFLQWAESWYRDLMIHGLRGDAEGVVNLDMLTELQRGSAQAVLERLLSSAADAAGAAKKIQRNLNRRMVLEQFLFGVVRGV
ncbi:MAG: DNA polymerase III subunit delta' [Deltaproteobacteria bacterium]|nr:DNA polymerase III subunit delta' [Deltaproteobacteria bacterium]